MSIPHRPQNRITIARPRLSARLEEGLQRRLTLVTAPAGAGKTTLLAQWARGVRQPVAWVTLAEHDREPARLLARLADALETVAAVGVGLPGRNPEAGFLEWLNGAAQVPVDWALILDNCQAVEGAALGGLASPLLDHLPPQLHLFLASRTVPDLPLGRLRVRGQLAELTGADLAFAPEEAGALWQSATGLRVTEAGAAALHARTDGWALGLLRAAAVARRVGMAETLASFSGRDPVLARYLAVEVLSRQAPAVRAFLRRTAALERLSAALCNAATGRRDGQAMLEYLERANLFIIPLDDERREYRYYRLFAEFLQSLA